MARRHWWKALLLVFVVGAAGVVFMGVQTYTEAPPVAPFVAPDGTVVLEASAITRGQQVFQRQALMEYGSLFGDGGMRGPDFTAEALHQVATAMTAFHQARLPAGADPMTRLGVAARVREELKENGHDPSRGVIRLSQSQVAGLEALRTATRDKFTRPGPEAFLPRGYLSRPDELRDLADFFFWGAWVTAARRPGCADSYTHNWPHDPEAGNTLTPQAVFWSLVGTLSLFLALGAVLVLYGRFDEVAGWRHAEHGEPTATETRVAEFRPTPSQRATFKFFATAAALFGLQVLAGILTVHDFVGLTEVCGVDLRVWLPLPVVRSWHVQFSVLWIATCWIAGSLFVLPLVHAEQPPGQRALIDVLYGMLVVVVLGTLLGGIAGPMGWLGDWWRLLGNQGWEFVELGRVWQVLLFLALVLWAVIMARGLLPALRLEAPFALPGWMLYSVVAIVLLFLSSFVAGPETNFVIVDFWRWMVIHMWAECFFEVFTTVIIAWFMVLLGLVERPAAERIVFFATLLFLGSGFLGISHNFYWNAKPQATLAIGSVFSTMQVVPLMLLTLEAWRFRRLPEEALRRGGDQAARFGQSEAFLFLLAVNFWNFLGAGVFGFLINLPVVNYFEHGTYLTVNHGHAALMGVYGNLSIAAMLLCSRYLIRPERWSRAPLRCAFWSLNVGLMLMVVLDLFPAGLLQLQAVLERGLWYARSQAFVMGPSFQTLTWLRLVGGALFVLGGVLPLVVFMLGRLGALRPADGAGDDDAPAVAELAGS